MADDDRTWRRIGSVLEQRFNALGITLSELQRRSGVSDTRWRAYFAGQPIRRADKIRGVCDGLGFSRDSIDLMLAGKKPIVLDGQGPRPDLDVRVAALEKTMAETKDRIEELARLLQDRLGATQ